MPSSRSIFISYRRSDSISETGRIYDRLVTEFGREHIFKDVDSIPLGVDFAAHLDKAVSQCQVVLVVIGNTWITVTDADGRCRLDNPGDFVRIEVESALKRGIPVIPVLLEGVDMPTRSELPDSLHAFVGRNAVRVGDDPSFHSDVSRLINGMKRVMHSSPVDDYDDEENYEFDPVLELSNYLNRHGNTICVTIFVMVLGSCVSSFLFEKSYPIIELTEVTDVTTGTKLLVETTGGGCEALRSEPKEDSKMVACLYANTQLIAINDGLETGWINVRGSIKGDGWLFHHSLRRETIEIDN